MSDVTVILQAIGRGEERTLDELLPLVYQELRQMAAARMASGVRRPHVAADRFGA